MKFRTLEENLRKALRLRIADGGLTGLRLAKQTGFQQAHISNFLNRKRSLSIDGMDKVLNVQHLSVFGPAGSGRDQPTRQHPAPSEDEFENVFLVEGEVAAARPRIMSMKVKDILKFKRGFLRKLRPEMEGDRKAWERFVSIRVDGREGMSMYPRLLPGANVLIDRHYNSLKPYRKNEANMYAIRKGGTCTVKYAEVSGRHLVLRPQNPAYPVEVLLAENGRGPGEYIVGRVCHVGIEV